jgi:hypothetical protein
MIAWNFQAKKRTLEKSQLVRLHQECPMPAKDIHHDAAKSALIKDGWTI